MNKKPGSFLFKSLSMFYLGFLIVLPIVFLIIKTGSYRLTQLWSSLIAPQSLFCLKLTILMAVGLTLVNMISGSLVAWALVRYRFPWRSFLNIMVDIPFAIPTVVTGIMLVFTYGPSGIFQNFLKTHQIEILFTKPAIFIALLFVSFPFVVRSLEPVLSELDREMEDAASILGANTWVRFRRIIFPAIWPAILSGGALSFSRAIGEFGSIILVAGNIPFRTQMASVFIYGEIESDNMLGALVVSLVLLLLSFSMLFVMYRLQNKRVSDV
jgi:sulfate transport system permease protein